MARGRIIDRSIWTNLQFSAVEVLGRLLYIGMVDFADDEGRMRADPRYLKAHIFPYDDIKIEKIKELRDKLATPLPGQDESLIVLYDVQGNEYLYHPNWERYQPIRKDRLQPSKIPPPPKRKKLILLPEATSPVPQRSTIGIPDDNQKREGKKVIQRKEEKKSKGIIYSFENEIKTIFDFWNNLNVIVHTRLSGHDHHIRAHLKALTELGVTPEQAVKDTQETMNNYAVILAGDEYFWKYKWTLSELLLRGYDKFRTVNKPFLNFLRDKSQVKELSTEEQLSKAGFKK